MDNIDLQVLKAASEWRRAGHACVLGTIVRTWGSAPRPVGSNVVIRDDGLVVGSVSGGCVEDDLVARVRAQGMSMQRPEAIRYGVSAEEATRFGLPCGGTLELLLEPVRAHSAPSSSSHMRATTLGLEMVCPRPIGKLVSS